MTESSAATSPNPASRSSAAGPFDPFAGPQIQLVVPITPPQAEIWLACLLGGDDANRAYNESVTLVFTGPLDHLALQEALRAVVQRHEALRSVFSPDGQYSCVLREVGVALHYQDISQEPTRTQEHVVAAYLRQEAHHLFDLRAGPLLKAGLIQLTPDQHYFILTAHHIVCDGWSMGILLQDLSAFYSAHCQRLSAKLPVVTSFSHYADQQLVYNRSADYSRVEQFWLNQYQGPVPVLHLPTDFPRPAVRTYEGARLDYPLPPELVAGVKKVGVGAGSSFVTTLLAAFEVLLYQVTGQEDIVVGLPAAGQSVTGLSHLVGHCVNLLPLRSQPRGESGFTEYLRQRKTALFDAYDHQQLTFGSLLQQLRLGRDVSRVPLVPVVFNVDMGLADGVRFEELDFQLRHNPRAYETFELFVNASGSEKALVLEWSYNTALFTAETIDHLMARFEALLRSIAANPTTRLRDLAAGAGRAPALPACYAALNDTARPYPATKLLHQLLAEQARATPQNTAVKFGTTEMSYAALDNTANQLANYLRDEGLQPGDVVALALARSCDLVVALLASMKCGATYLPLDPSYPPDRLAYMLTDSAAKFLLTSTPSAAFSSVTSFPVAAALAAASSYSTQEPPVPVDSRTALYVLYTSGSTGKPKGVAISHRNAVNFLCSMRQAPGISATDRLLAVTTISFDIAGLELFLPLLTGATVVLADELAAKDGRALLQLMAAERITIMQATPASWRMLLDAGWEQALPLKVLCGGEALTLELAHRLLAKSQSVWNLYGPTETTIWSTIKQIQATDQVIAIGKPIANTQVYLLDEHHRPVGMGAIGELCIAGDGVAQGYVRRAGLTAERFIANPFSPAPDAKLYRTGDLGRILESGDLQCLGRLDQQIKIRGHRIEPQEIEQALAALPDISQAVVLMHERQPGDTRLVAFVTCSGALTAESPPPKPDSWQKVLREQLPAHMVPSEFVVLAALPLTPNGKIDRKALLQHIFAAPSVPAAGKYIGPRTDAERIVASIWQSCLAIQQVHVLDNFFALGGHSLIAVQVMARIEQETGKRLPLAALFEHPTVEKLAALLKPDSNSITWDSLVPIKPYGRKTPLYIVHGAGFNVLIFNALSQNMDVEQPVYGLQAKGLNGIDEPLQTIEAMAAYYIEAILATNPRGPYALAGYSFGGIIAYEMTKQLLAAGKEVTFLGLFDTYASQSDSIIPWPDRTAKRIQFAIRKYIFELVRLKRNPAEAIEAKLSSLKRLTVERIRYGKKKQYEMNYGHPYNVGVAQETAWRNYRLLPQAIKVHLFRSKEHVFYMDDFDYLGWREFALSGVIVHDIPGNHNFIFSPPNDQESALILQKALDTCTRQVSGHGLL